MKTHSFIRNLIFSVLAGIIFFSAVEIILRVAGFDYLPDDAPLVILRDFNRTDFGDLYRFDPDTLWSPRPGALYAKTDTEERINSLGFRGPEVAKKKPPRTLRVACLGDSSTFGFGILYPQTYTATLQKYLGNVLDTDVEVVNAGVVGYSSTQALARLRRDVLPLRPDVVTVMLGAVNESGLMKSTDARRVHAAAGAHKSKLRTLRTALLKLRTAQLMLRIIRKSTDKENKTPRVPFEQFNKDLNDIRKETERIGAKLIIVSPHRMRKIEEQTPALLKYTALLEKFSKNNNIIFVNVHDEFRKPQYVERALFRDDYHPDISGHDLIAQMLAWEIAQGIREGRIRIR